MTLSFEYTLNRSKVNINLINDQLWPLLETHNKEQELILGTEIQDKLFVWRLLSHLTKERGNYFIAGSKMTHIRPWYGFGIKTLTLY